ncbi:universal stress protein [Streptomyces physcomitrii]|uniref:universal stress protein n=1 Tax=Streptomyces physcomitrii TaxID=2724184 RepID=UPI00341C4354
MSPVVAAVDGSDGARRAARWATEEAVRTREPLHLVCASLWDRLPVGQSDDVVGRLTTEAHAVLEAQARELTGHWPDLAVSTRALPEETVPALLAAVTAELRTETEDLAVRGRLAAEAAAPALVAAGAGADLLVVGCRRPFGQLSTVTHTVVHHSPCPVAVVPY